MKCTYLPVVLNMHQPPLSTEIQLGLWTIFFSTIFCHQMQWLPGCVTKIKDQILILFHPVLRIRSNRLPCFKFHHYWCPSQSNRESNAVTAPPHRPGVHCPGGWGGLPPVRDSQPQQQDGVLAEGAGPPHPHGGQGDLHLWPPLCLSPLEDPDLWPGHPQYPPRGPGGRGQVPVPSQRPEQDLQICRAGGCHTSGMSR